MKNINQIIDFIKNEYNNESYVPLHRPIFMGNEKEYLNYCIDSSYVSSVGNYVTDFEKSLADYCGVKYAVACVNGTNALHLSLLSLNIKNNDEVITQPISFIATANSILYSGAKPIFIDVDLATMSLCPKKLEEFLMNNTYSKDNICFNKISGNPIRACIPVHIFGRSCLIEEISEICKKYNIELIEDAAEALGSFYKTKHLGSFGRIGMISFNGNKIITTGGGGAIITNDKKIAQKIKHLSTQAKISHPWDYFHDELGYNYRMPNINAAIGLAQLENLDFFVSKKRLLSRKYKKLFSRLKIKFFKERKYEKSNYWLNCILLKDLSERNKFLEITNSNNLQCRPIWGLINEMPHFKIYQCENIDNSKWLSERIVCIPSSVNL